jgi:S-adenosylmethionine:tRNA ribosyltransferase-isomerase
MHPSELRIEDFSYELPSERIAKYPLKNRYDSKLLIYRNGNISASQFTSIVKEIPTDTLLVYNNTKVFFARLEFFKSTGARIEVFCLEPVQKEINQAMQSTRALTWKCLIGNAKKWKGEVLECNILKGKLEARLLGKEGADYLVELSWNTDITFAELADQIGNVPLPPYLQREAEESDKERYQTVYSKNEGSVAAPTAGLHFTDEILEELRSKGVTELPITLHVGAGTFQPVKAETMKGHDMHAEEFTVSKTQLLQLHQHIKANKPIVVIGTTSLRALESLYWIHENEPLQNVAVNQWTAYESERTDSPLQKLESLIGQLESHGLEAIHGKTQIIIAPGYKFRFANGLVTNFHQPKSTLLLLVSALVGQNWKNIYHYALQNNFRFLSYGDSSLLWHN